MFHLILYGGAFSCGALIASFLNVIIWRVPRGESIVFPGSHCPKCEAPIRWYQNIPILSWLCLHGRCANCKAPISPRYILIELLGGCLFLAAFLRQGLYLPLGMCAMELLVTWIWIALMIAGAMIDFDHKVLPRFVTVGGLILGVGWNGFVSICQFVAAPEPHLPDSIIHSLLGLVLGVGLLTLVRWLGRRMFRRELLGLGEILLMGAVGAFLGPKAVLSVLVLSALIGVLVGKFVKIPYGTSVCLAALLLGVGAGVYPFFER